MNPYAPRHPFFHRDPKKLILRLFDANSGTFAIGADQWIELPAGRLVKAIELAGGIVIRVNVYGQGLKGVVWQDEDGKMLFTPLLVGDYALEILADDQLSPRWAQATIRHAGYERYEYLLKLKEKETKDIKELKAHWPEGEFGGVRCLADVSRPVNMQLSRWSGRLKEIITENYPEWKDWEEDLYFIPGGRYELTLAGSYGPEFETDPAMADTKAHAALIRMRVVTRHRRTIRMETVKAGFFYSQAVGIMFKPYTPDDLRRYRILQFGLGRLTQRYDNICHATLVDVRHSLSKDSQKMEWLKNAVNLLNQEIEKEQSEEMSSDFLIRRLRVRSFTGFFENQESRDYGEPCELLLSAQYENAINRGKGLLNQALASMGINNPDIDKPAYQNALRPLLGMFPLSLNGVNSLMAAIGTGGIKAEYVADMVNQQLTQRKFIQVDCQENPEARTANFRIINQYDRPRILLEISRAILEFGGNIKTLGQESFADLPDGPGIVTRLVIENVAHNQVERIIKALGRIPDIKRPKELEDMVNHEMRLVILPELEFSNEHGKLFNLLSELWEYQHNINIVRIAGSVAEDKKHAHIRLEIQVPADAGIEDEDLKRVIEYSVSGRFIQHAVNSIPQEERSGNIPAGSGSNSQLASNSMLIGLGMAFIGMSNAVMGHAAAQTKDQIDQIQQMHDIVGVEEMAIQARDAQKDACKMLNAFMDSLSIKDLKGLLILGKKRDLNYENKLRGLLETYQSKGPARAYLTITSVKKNNKLDSIYIKAATNRKGVTSHGVIYRIGVRFSLEQQLMIIKSILKEKMKLGFASRLLSDTRGEETVEGAILAPLFVAIGAGIAAFWLWTIPALVIAGTAVLLAIAWKAPKVFQHLGQVSDWLRNRPWGTLIGRTAAVILVPLVLFIILPIPALLAKVSSPGPIIFAQERIGYQGKIIRIWKLRTFTDEEDLANRKITWFGKLIRPTGLDEVLQIFSVIKGDMQWFGPRPHQKEEVNQAYIDEVLSKSRPGFFGWTVLGEGIGSKGNMPIEERIKADSLELKQRTAANNVLLFLCVIRDVIYGLGRGFNVSGTVLGLKQKVSQKFGQFYDWLRNLSGIKTLHNIWNNNRIVKYYSKFKADGYSMDNKVFVSFGVVNPELMGQLADRIGSGMKILSIGSGRGVFEKRLKDNKNEVFCIDITPEMLAIAKREGLSNLVNGDAHAMPFAKGSFDVVIFPESIGHMEVRDALLQAKAVLKPNGKIIILTYTPYKVKNSKLYNCVSSDDLIRILNEIGLNINKSEIIPFSDKMSSIKLIYIEADKRDPDINHRFGLTRTVEASI